MIDVLGRFSETLDFQNRCFHLTPGIIVIHDNLHLETVGAKILLVEYPRSNAISRLAVPRRRMASGRAWAHSVTEFCLLLDMFQTIDRAARS